VLGRSESPGSKRAAVWGRIRLKQASVRPSSDQKMESSDEGQRLIRRAGVLEGVGSLTCVYIYT